MTISGLPIGTSISGICDEEYGTLVLIHDGDLDYNSCSLDFKFGEGSINDIVTKPGLIKIYAKKSFIDSIDTIDTKNVVIKIKSSKIQITHADIVVASNAVIKIKSSGNLVEHQPWITTHNAVLKYKASKSIISGNREFDLPKKYKDITVFKWTTTIPLKHEISGSFKPAIIMDNLTSYLWSVGKMTDYTFLSGYYFCSIVDPEAYDIIWGITKNKADVSFTDIRPGIFPVDDKLDVIWITGIYKDKKILVQYISPESKDVFNSVVFDEPKKLFTDNSVYWGDTEPVDRSNRVYYGEYWYSLWCDQKYHPPDVSTIKIKHKEELIPDVCKDLILLHYQQAYACPAIHKHSGTRDQYINIPEPPPSPYYSWSYFMSNTCLVKRLPDNTEIEVISVSIQTDRKSWLWDFSITIPESTYLDLIRPQLSGSDVVLIDIEININDNKWICRVERWSESKSFGQKSWTAYGRSPSCELSSPYDIPISFTNDSDIHGGQLIQNLLLYTGWEISWGFDNNSSTYSDFINPTTDWLIPAGACSITEQTKIQAIQYILEAIKGCIITNPNCYDSADKKLIIIPEYKDRPWNWLNNDYEQTIIPNYCSEIGTEYNINPSVDLVIASGDSKGGVIVVGTKDGTSGTKLGDMFTHSLITTENVGQEACKNIMSSGGTWFERTFRFFSLDNGAIPTSIIPGVLYPGQLIRFLDGADTWRAQVDSVQIDAAWGGNGLEVSQTVKLDQYVGG